MLRIPTITVLLFAMITAKPIDPKPIDLKPIDPKSVLGPNIPKPGVSWLMTENGTMPSKDIYNCITMSMAVAQKACQFAGLKPSDDPTAYYDKYTTTLMSLGWTYSSFSITNNHTDSAVLDLSKEAIETAIVAMTAVGGPGAIAMMMGLKLLHDLKQKAEKDPKGMVNVYHQALACGLNSSINMDCSEDNMKGATMQLYHFNFYTWKKWQNHIIYKSAVDVCDMKFRYDSLVYTEQQFAINGGIKAFTPLYKAKNKTQFDAAMDSYGDESVLAAPKMAAAPIGEILTPVRHIPAYESLKGGITRIRHQGSTRSTLYD